jgi:CRISPR-associated protein Cas5h
MRGLLFQLSGPWAQFRRPETNNTPLTHDFVTKTALVGLIGAVLGFEREDMRKRFPVLCDDLVYGVEIIGAVNKQSWAFTLRNVMKHNDADGKAPRQMEFIRNPNYLVAIGLYNERSAAVFDQFDAALRNSEAKYTPVLGLHNCPAELRWFESVTFREASGQFATRSFAPSKNKFVGAIDTSFRIGFDRIPTHQSENWWNTPNRYIDVVYPSDGSTLRMDGEHFVSDKGTAWCLI